MPTVRLRVIVAATLAVIILSIPTQARDTLWTQTYWNGYADTLSCVAETADRGFILTGTSFYSDRWQDDVTLIKTDSLGVVDWSIVLGDATYDEAGYHVLQTLDGGYLVSARSNIFPGGIQGVRLYRTDFEGDTLWTTSWCPDNRSAIPQDAIITEEGNYAITGQINRAGGNFDDAFILIVDDNGDILDYGFYGDSFFQDSRFITQMADSGFVIAGNANYVYTTLYDWRAVRTDKYLSVIWDSLYVLTDSYDFLYGATKTENGIVMTGLSRGDGWVHGIDFDGNTQFSKSISISHADEEYHDISVNADGGLTVAGWVGVAGANRDYVLINLEPDGDTIWTYTFGGGYNDQCCQIIPTYDDNFAVGGTSQSFVSGQCFYIGKFEEGCCRYRVGDANGSGDDEPTIGDISIMIDAKFISVDDDILPCLGEADVNVSGGRHPTGADVTIGDITYLIDYLFVSIGMIELYQCQ